MSDSGIRAFTAHMKLRELQRYRARLHERYDAMVAAAAAAPNPRAALLALYEGLRQLKVAERPVHPDVANLDVVLLESAAGLDGGQTALVEAWTRRLEDVVRQGRACADAITLFGGLLGEWLDPKRGLPCGDEAVAEARHFALQRAEAIDLRAVVEPLERRLGDGELQRLRAWVAEHTGALLGGTGVFESFEEDVRALTRDANLAPEVAAELRRLLEVDPQTMRLPRAMDELQSAMRMAWEDIAEWDWPEVVPMVPLWARNRYRVRPAPDVISLLTTQIIGTGVSALVSRVDGTGRRNRLLRLQRLLDLQAPEIIVDQEREALAQTFDLSDVTAPFAWHEAAESPQDTGPEGSVRRLRLGFMAEVDSTSWDGGYGDGGYTADPAIARAFGVVHAEIELARAVDPTRPVIVLKTDLRDFYPSLPHSLVSGLLGWLGAEPRFVRLVERVLQIPWSDTKRAQRGLPLGLPISRALGWLVVAALQGHIRAAADVLVLTLVDDIVVLARSPEDAAAAWAAIERFVAAAGLGLRSEKSGSVCVPVGELPATLPVGPVRWGMLELDSDGQWVVSDAALRHFMEVSRAHIEAHGALLDRVAAYRKQLRYLLTWLAPAARLHAGHPGRVWEAVLRFGQLQFGAGAPGVTAMLKAELGRRFVGGEPLNLPDAWLHWPLTAGGMALPHVATALVPLLRAHSVFEEPPRPGGVPAADLESGDRGWGAWYGAAAAQVEPIVPEETDAARPLVEAFISRGGRVRGQEQKDLAPSWRWILSTFGPDILEHFGRYDFLDTELVPLDLIQSSFGR